MWQQSFLYKVYRKQKWLFVLFLGFTLCQTVAFVSGVTFSPFYNFGMYSAPVYIDSSYQVLQYKSAKGADNQWWLPQKDDQVLMTQEYYNDRHLNDSVLLLSQKLFGNGMNAQKFKYELSEAGFCEKYNQLTGAWRLNMGCPLSSETYLWNSKSLVKHE